MPCTINYQKPRVPCDNACLIQPSKPMRIHKWLSTWHGNTKNMLTASRRIDSWRSGWRLGWLSHPFYVYFLPPGTLRTSLSCVPWRIGDTVHVQLTLMPCAGHCVGPMSLGASFALVHPHGAPAANFLLLDCTKRVKLSSTSSQDGMDQAKWCIPRNRSSVLPKSLSGLSRPKFKVQGVWVHGVMLKLWVLDPRCPSASSVLETMTRTIESAMDRCEEMGVKPPNELLCWVALLQFYHKYIVQTVLSPTTAFKQNTWNSFLNCLRLTIALAKTRTTAFWSGCVTSPQPWRWVYLPCSSQELGIHMVL